MGEVTPAGADVYAETSRRRVTGQPALQRVRRAGPSGALLGQGSLARGGRGGWVSLRKRAVAEAGQAWLVPQGHTDHKVSNLGSDWPHVMGEQWQFGGAY